MGLARSRQAQALTCRLRNDKSPRHLIVVSSSRLKTSRRWRRPERLTVSPDTARRLPRTEQLWPCRRPAGKGPPGVAGAICFGTRCYTSHRPLGDSVREHTPRSTDLALPPRRGNSTKLATRIPGSNTCLFTSLWFSRTNGGRGKFGAVRTPIPRGTHGAQARIPAHGRGRSPSARDMAEGTRGRRAIAARKVQRQGGWGRTQ